MRLLKVLPPLEHILGAKLVLISHLHLDHIGSLDYLDLMEGNKINVYIPHKNYYEEVLAEHWRLFFNWQGRREWLGFSKEEYSKVVESLISKGIIERVSVSMGKGRPIVLYQVKGRRPSVKHEYYVYWLLDKLTSKGLVCRLARIGEAKPDIWVPKLSLAINVELGKSNIEENVKKALKEFKKVIVCSDDRKILGRIKKKFKDRRLIACYIWEVFKTNL